MACEQDGGPLCGQCYPHCRYGREAELEAIHDEEVAQRKDRYYDEGLIEVYDGVVSLSELGEVCVSQNRRVRDDLDELFPGLVPKAR